MKQQSYLWLRPGLLIVCLLLSAVLGVLAWIPDAQAVLPPRPTATPPAPPEPKTGGESPTPIPLVAEIRLQVEPDPGGLMSVIQWQDKLGDWQDVEGWRGSVSEGKTVWWVEEKDFGKKPYRWIVYEETSGKVLAITDPFTLPLQRGVVVYTVELGK